MTPPAAAAAGTSNGKTDHESNGRRQNDLKHERNGDNGDVDDSNNKIATPRKATGKESTVKFATVTKKNENENTGNTNGKKIATTVNGINGAKSSMKGADDNDEENSQASWIPEEDDDTDASLAGDEYHDDMIVVDPLPAIVSFSHGLRRKESAVKLQSWVALALTLDGRDKITKVCQYVSRLLAWWLSAVSRHPNHARRFAALKVTLTNSRKAFRLGRSFIELHRLRNMGLLETLSWHLKRSLHLGSGGGEEDADGVADLRPPTSDAQRRVIRQASSNIGWGPRTVEESYRPKSVTTASGARRLYRSLSSVAYRMYRPLLSQMSSIEGKSSSSSSTAATPLWKLLGSAGKMIGLMGFWAGDNTNFLAGAGLFDDYNLSSDKERLARRKSLQSRAAIFANRFYFAGAISGLLASFRSYLAHRNDTLRPLQRRLVAAATRVAGAASTRTRRGRGRSDEDDHDREEREHELEEARRAVDQAKEKQFVLFLALLKSCADVFVFSNNPGIDLWKKRRGKKMHEGFHCLCGLVSASTVIYNNFPNASLQNKNK